MNTEQPIFDGDAAERIVYVRPVKAEELPDEVRAQTGNAPEVYALHAPNGDRLALVRDRKMAFVIARQNDLSPVHVH